jgi:hypothetical protein
MRTTRIGRGRDSAGARCASRGNAAAILFCSAVFTTLFATLFAPVPPTQAQLNCATWPQGNGYNLGDDGNPCPPDACQKSGYQCLVNGVNVDEWYTSTPIEPWFLCNPVSNQQLVCDYVKYQCSTMGYYSDNNCGTDCTGLWYWVTCLATTPT